VSHRRDWARTGAVAAVVLICDQVTKALVRGGIEEGADHRVIPGFVTLVHDQNSGVAFSLLTGSDAGVLIITLVVLAGLIAFHARNRTRRLMWVVTGMIVGGALGNLLDRVRAGSVTDFIKLPAWPAFNLADSAITLGVIALILILGFRGASARPS
jgi:signal peptidase II